MLADEIQRACAQAALELGIQRARRSASEYSPLARAVTIACRGEPPPLTVQALGRRAGCDYTTIEHHWRACRPDGVSLRGFLDETLLLRARARKSVHLTWTDVGREYAIDVDRLRRIARRKIGRWPRGDDCAAWMELAGRYREEVRRVFPQSQVKVRRERAH
jgi:hypothetical protein